MEQGLTPSETTSFFAPSRIEHYRVVPLKLALKQLELKLSQVNESLCVVSLKNPVQGLFILDLPSSVRLGDLALFRATTVLD